VVVVDLDGRTIGLTAFGRASPTAPGRTRVWPTTRLRSSRLFVL
jgi:hypothetical protein